MTQLQTNTDVRVREAERTRPLPICHVCGEPIEDKVDITCRNCDRPVHVAWTQDQLQSACSQAVPLDQCCSLGFVCNPCAEEEGLTT